MIRSNDAKKREQEQAREMANRLRALAADVPADLDDITPEDQGFIRDAENLMGEALENAVEWRPTTHDRWGGDESEAEGPFVEVASSEDSVTLEAEAWDTVERWHLRPSGPTCDTTYRPVDVDTTAPTVAAMFDTIPSENVERVYLLMPPAEIGAVARAIADLLDPPPRDDRA